MSGPNGYHLTRPTVSAVLAASLPYSKIPVCPVDAGTQSCAVAATGSMLAVLKDMLQKARSTLNFEPIEVMLGSRDERPKIREALDHFTRLLVLLEAVEWVCLAQRDVFPELDELCVTTVRLRGRLSEEVVGPLAKCLMSVDISWTPEERRDFLETKVLSAENLARMCGFSEGSHELRIPSRLHMILEEDWHTAQKEIKSNCKKKQTPPPAKA